MKKITAFLFAFVLLLLSTSGASAQTAYKIFATDLKTEKPSYEVGEVIRGEFRLDNYAEYRESDLYFTTTVYLEKDGRMIILDEKVHPKSLYLEADSKRVIQFEHELMRAVPGPIFFEVGVFNGAEIYVGGDRTTLVVKGQGMGEFATLASGYITIDEEDFRLQQGPTVSSGSSATLQFTYKDFEGEKEVMPVITLRNRTYTSEPLHVIKGEPMLIRANQEYSVDLPTDLDPLVYAGVITLVPTTGTFDSEEVYFRYITEGMIATIINANADRLSGKKGDTVNIKVSYVGSPLAFNLDGSFEQEPTMATVSVELKNEIGEVVGRVQQEANVNQRGEVVLPVTLEANAQHLSVLVTISHNGKKISEYSTTFPSEKELKQAYSSTGLDSALSTMLTLTIAAMLLLGILFLRRKFVGKKVIVVGLAFLVLSYGTFEVIRKTEATSYPLGQLYEYHKVGANWGDMNVNSLSSPRPYSSAVYAPGEQFHNIILNLTSPESNTGAGIVSFYAPPYAWWNAHFPGYPSLPSGVTDPNWYWDGSGTQAWVDGKLWRYKDHWNHVVHGSRIYHSGVGTSGTISVYSKTGNLYIPTNLHAPYSAGNHFFHFLIITEGHPLLTTVGNYGMGICVTGAGTCPGEPAIPPPPPSACPNLTGHYTMDGNGVISKDGVVQSNLTQASDGNCYDIPPPCPEGQQRDTPTGACYSTTVFSCSVSPSAPQYGDDVVLTANPAGASSYAWRMGGIGMFEEVIGTGRTYTVGSPGSGSIYNYNVTIVHNGETQARTCSFSVTPAGCGPRPSDEGICRESDWTINTYKCMQQGWVVDTSVSCIPPPPPSPTPTPPPPPPSPLPLVPKEFAFRPNITATLGGTCPLFVEVENASACRIVKRGSTLEPQVLTSTGGNPFKVTGSPTSPGTYVLQCANSTGNYEDLGTKSCYSSMQFQER